MAHHHRVPRSRLFEEFHIGRVVPGKFPALSDSPVSIYCDDSNDHKKKSDTTQFVDKRQSRNLLDSNRSRNFLYSNRGRDLSV